MRRTGAADIEERANAWRSGSAKAQSPEHAHQGDAIARDYARQHAATHGRQADTPAASAVRPTITLGTPAAARTDMHGTAFSSTNPNAAAGMRQVLTRTDGRGSTPPSEKQPHTSGGSDTGIAHTNTDAGLKSHTAQAPDGSSAASKAQRPTGFMGDPGLGTQQDDAYPDDSEFRKDYDSRYANTGASYEEYQRAYSHRATFGRDERYRGADWPGVEASARANWESRYPESAWERFKTAVRHGWERVTRG